MESKTCCAGPDTCSTSKSSLMISRMSTSLGEDLAVTKLPQTKIRRSRPPLAASSRIVRNRPASHRRLGDEPPKRDMNSGQSAVCTPGGRSPSTVKSGSTTKTITDGSPSVCSAAARVRPRGPPNHDVSAFVGTDQLNAPPLQSFPALFAAPGRSGPDSTAERHLKLSARTKTTAASESKLAARLPASRDMGSRRGDRSAEGTLKSGAFDDRHRRERLLCQEAVLLPALVLL